MGPLEGVKIIEFGGIGAIPYCGQMLADMGASIIRIERKGGPKARLGAAKFNLNFRNRQSIFLNFKSNLGVKTLQKMIEMADGTIEGFRPGVMERIGFGPEECFLINPKLIYGRLTGYGREGPLCKSAGHDINYLALSGGLHAIGPKDLKPSPPLNLVADFGGGGLMLAFGMVCALLEREKSGKGQVVDSAMIDGCASLLSAFFGWFSGGIWHEERCTNLLDGGAPFYDTYETSDGNYIALGSIEPEFYEAVLHKIGLHDILYDQMNKEKWKDHKNKLSEIFRTKTRDQWCEILQGDNFCVSPVLSFSEALKHPHNIEHGTFIEVDNIIQPAPNPRFSRTKPVIKISASEPNLEPWDALHQWGISSEEISELRKQDSIGTRKTGINSQ